MNDKQKFLVDLYLEYVNDFLTIDKIADYYGIHKSAMKAMIAEGKSLLLF